MADVHGIVSANPYVQTNRQTPEMMSRASCIYIDRAPIAELIHLDFQIKRSFCTCVSLFLRAKMFVHCYGESMIKHL